MANAMIIMLIWVAQISLVVVFADSGWLQAQIVNEKQGVADYLGADLVTSLGARADAAFRSFFVNTGVIDSVHRFLIPNADVPKHGTEGLAPWFFVWLDDSLRTFWLMAYQGIFRFLILSEWLPYMGALLLAASVDGLVIRKVRKENLGYANPVRYRLGVRALVVLAVVPLIYLTAPISITPLFAPIWVIALSMVLMMVAANAQDRI